MSDIEKEAKRLAEEELPSHLTPPFDEDKIIKYFLISQLGFDEEKVRETLESEHQELLKIGTSKIKKTLESRNAHVREILTKSSYPVFQPEKWKRVYDPFNPKEDLGVSYVGPDKPVRKTWKSVLKDPRPGSKLKARLQDWLDSEPWHELWTDSDDGIMMQLDRTYFDRSHVVIHLYSREIDYSWAPTIIIRKKEKD